MGPRRRLDPPERPRRGHAEARSHILAHGFIRSVVAVFGAEEVVEELDAGRPLLAEGLGLGVPPVGDGPVQAESLDPRRLLPAVAGPLASAAEVVADRPLGDAEEPRRLGLRLASLLQ